MPNDKTEKRRDKMVIFEFDKLENDKLANSGLLPSKPKTKNMKKKKKGGGGAGCSGHGWCDFLRERTSL